MPISGFKLKKAKKRGFTLAEMLVVISIISIFVIVSLGYLSGTIRRGRDAKRRADLEQLRSALEMYRADNMALGESYPDDIFTASPNPLESYMRAVEDPMPSSYGYSYFPVGGAPATRYCLGAFLENSVVDAAHACIAANCDGSTLLCNNSGKDDLNCNYCVYNP